MDKFKQSLAYIITTVVLSFMISGTVLFMKGLADKSGAKLQLEYIVEQCSNNKYVILNDVLIMCPEVVINKPKERKMS